MAAGLSEHLDEARASSGVAQRKLWAKRAPSPNTPDSLSHKHSAHPCERRDDLKEGRCLSGHGKWTKAQRCEFTALTGQLGVASVNVQVLLNPEAGPLQRCSLQ